jgi:hypothetical protein
MACCRGRKNIPWLCTKDDTLPTHVTCQKESKKISGSCQRTIHESNSPLLGPKNCPKNGSFSLIERVILSAGAMLIFSVSFQIDQMPEGEDEVI